MRTRRTVTVTATDATEKIPPTIHAAFATWIVGMLVLSSISPPFYYNILQEDRFVEWLTATVFLAAGILHLRGAIRSRRLFDGLVGLFCIFVGGEEFSWGQRLLGFTPPDVFLEHNTQQEFTLHNFADIFGQPKGVLILALAGYGVMLPALRRLSAARLLDKVGATPPPLQLTPWFAIAAILLVWYPVEFTGEWVEALAATLFLSATPAWHRARWFGGAAAAAGVLTVISARGISRSPAAVQCARIETRALLQDIGSVLDTDADLFHDEVHKRLQSAIEAGYLPDVLINYETARCGADSDDEIPARRRYGLDPWGMPYWIRSGTDEHGRAVITVYSFGPNRKRDRDDIASHARIE